MTQIQSLNGLWQYRVGKGEFTPKNVPFSQLPVGHSECKRSFDLSAVAEKIFLKFDGITYAAKVYLNDCLLGEMLPYSEYSFDITDIAKPCDNQLLVELEDISPAFGPTAGWENFGGIIRDVNVIYKNNNYIKDVFAHTVLCDNYTAAVLTVETECSVRDNAEFKISLSYGEEVVLSYTQPANGEPLQKKVSDIRLWSPETPELYELSVYLIENGEAVDAYKCNIGFREIACDKHRFLINGKPVFLKGVCKHEMYGESGHCPTEIQMEEDMRRIKETGCNFVRLVHYPHNKKIIEIADRLGLFVSEEPGLWWSDTADPEVSGGSLEVLKRTILRDRNHPSIAFWLCFNECRFTEQFLIDSAAVCRKYDPTRMVSGANCMNNEDTLKYYNICGFDFYTMHPYFQTFDRSLESAKILNDKPLLFTEWGGHYLYDNCKLMREFIGEMNKLYINASDEAALAGAFFWCWAEVNDFNRGRPACFDGVLREGLVTSDRNPTLVYDSFCEAIGKIGTEENYSEYWYCSCKKKPISGENLLKGYETEDFDTVFKAFADSEHQRKIMRQRYLHKAPVLRGSAPLSETPLLISDNTQVKIDCRKEAKELNIIGLVSFTNGYPLSGEYGEDIAEMTLGFEDGTEQKHTFKNGVDVTTVFTTNQSSRINPIAERAERFALFGYDKNFEDYVINSLKIKVLNTSAVKNITLKSLNNGYSLLIYGIF